MAFLKQTAAQIWDQWKDDVSQHLFIFPTRRSMLYFNRNLAAHVGRPIWLPNAMTLEDYVLSSSDLVIGDDLYLLYTLYQSAVEARFTKVSFQDFYSLGKVILSDFSDIDLSLVDVDLLFIKLEQDGPLELFKSDDIWHQVIGEGNTALKDQFRLNWNALGQMYRIFNHYLIKNKIGYKGLIYRRVISENSLQTTKESHPVIHIIGFHKLTKAEQDLLNKIKTSQTSYFYWNAPNLIFAQGMDAGLAVQEGIQEFRQSLTMSTVSHSPKIEIISTSGAMGQIQACCRILLEQKDKVIPEKIAIVLSDPVLLEPLMSAIPKDFSEINISMSYPLYYSPIKDLLDWILEWWANPSDRRYIERALADKILHHFYVKPFVKDYSLLEKGNHSQYIALDVIHSIDPLLENIFSIPKAQDSLSVLSRLFGIIQSLAEKTTQDFHRHILGYAEKGLSKLMDVTQKINTEWTIPFLRKLMLQYFIELKVPFKGEPLRGLQILGKLEMQNLSFDTLIFLGVNEGIWPNTHHQSTLPFSILHHFEIFSTTDRTLMTSYQFWTSVANASHVALLNSTGDDVLGAKGESRYIQQLRYGQTGLTFEQKVLSFSSDYQPSLVKSIPKSKTIMEKLIYFLTEKGLSATALNDFIACPFRFAYLHLFEVRSDQPEEKLMSAKAFGSIFHEILQKLYQDSIGQSFGALNFDQIQASVDTIVHKEYRSYFEIDEDLPLQKGIHWMEIQALKSSVIRILDFDKKDSDRSITGLEERLTSELKVDKFKIKIKGFVDRIDAKNNRYRIVDYKTGKSDVKPVKKLQFFEANYNAHVTQLLLYSWLWAQKYPHRVPVEALHYALKDELMHQVRIDDSECITKEFLSEFEQQLSGVIATMLDESLDFVQTEDRKACKYCAFQTLCERN